MFYMFGRTQARAVGKSTTFLARACAGISSKKFLGIAIFPDTSPLEVPREWFPGHCSSRRACSYRPTSILSTC